MSKALLIMFFAALCFLHAWPQAASPVRMKGRITDRDTQQPLESATVTLLYAKDSSHAASTFTDKDGAFTLKALPGAYQLYITYIGYQQQLNRVILTDILTDAGIIGLKKTGVTLGMVEIVELRAPMVVKKDTLEFNADYYKTRENAVMEELLKKLPGIEIDKDGGIKINGVPVKRILVDGKPFFGDDPKIAIRNLPAEMIDKVQLVDRRSDQAQFSGANDGKTEKTINVTVKKEKENKFSGRFSAGYGSNDRFALNGSLNRFGEQALSFLGAGNNINGVQATGMQIGGGDGIIRNWNGGINYSTTISPTLKITGSYFYNNSNSVNQRISARQNLLPDTTYYYNQNTNEFHNSISQSLDLRIEYNPDTTFTLSIGANAGYLKSNNSQDNAYESLGNQKQLVNRGIISNTRQNAPFAINSNIFLGKRFKKTGRTLSATIAENYLTSKQQLFNRSNNLFIQPDGETLLDTIDQRNDIRNPHLQFSLNITYTEPLYKDHFLDLVYTYSLDRFTSEKYAYDFNAIKGIYDSFNDSLSNSFKTTTASQQGSLSFRAQKQKYDYSIGLTMQLNSLNNNNISDGMRLQKYTNGFFPVAVFNYAFTGNRRLRFQYIGNIQPLDITLLQPVPNNNNPLYIQLGNPDLKPSTTHNATIGYNTVNPITFYNLSLNINTTLTRNKTIMATWLDSLGRQVSQPLNANGAYSLGINMANAFVVKKAQLNINTNTMLALNRDVNYTNGIPGNMSNLSALQSVNLNYTYKQVFDGSLGGSLNYNKAWYSQQKVNNINVYTYNLLFTGNITLPLNFTIGGNITYQHNAGASAGYNLEVTMVNAYIAKSFFKRKQVELKLQGFDLLNKNQGYTRTFGANYVEDVRTKVLERFFLFSCSYFIK